MFAGCGGLSQVLGWNMVGTSRGIAESCWAIENDVCVFIEDCNKILEEVMKWKRGRRGRRSEAEEGRSGDALRGSTDSTVTVSGVLHYERILK